MIQILMILPTKEETSQFPAMKERKCQRTSNFLVLKSFLNSWFENKSRAASVQTSTVLGNIHEALTDDPYFLVTEKVRISAAARQEASI